jgi:hypothetical protein
MFSSLLIACCWFQGRQSKIQNPKFKIKSALNTQRSTLNTQRDGALSPDVEATSCRLREQPKAAGMPLPLCIGGNRFVDSLALTEQCPPGRAKTILSETGKWEPRGPLMIYDLRFHKATELEGIALSILSAGQAVGGQAAW